MDTTLTLENVVTEPKRKGARKRVPEKRFLQLGLEEADYDELQKFCLENQVTMAQFAREATLRAMRRRRG